MRRTLIALYLLNSGTAMAAEKISPQFTHELPNAPGKQLTAVVVEYAPGEKSRPHHHASSAFIFAYVLEGAIRSQLEGEAEPHVYRKGESWFEAPGVHHIVSENANEREPARLLAVFVVAPNERLTIPDHEEK